MIKKSELVLGAGNKTMYHIGIGEEHLADKIILVGDPGRVPMISAFFDKIEFQSQNRELVYHLGVYKGTQVAVLSTGMGVDNIDIVITELDALANLNIQTGALHPKHRTLQLIRVGTCGILQPDVPLLSYMVSEYGLGLDGMIYFYKTDKADLQIKMTEEFIKQMNWSSVLPRPYITPASENLINKLDNSYIKGITATSPGFYGPQGRTVRAEVLLSDLSDKLHQIDINGHKIINLEMETSCLYALSHILSHEAITICLGIANRATGDFSSNYHKEMEDLIQTILNKVIL